MATFILRRTEDAQLKQPDVEIAKVRAISYEKHLTALGINPEDYDTVYSLAVIAHNERGALGPFGIDAIIQGAQRFIQSKVTPSEHIRERKVKVECEECNGTGLKFDFLGKILYDENKKVVKCEKCYDSKD